MGPPQSRATGGRDCGAGPSAPVNAVHAAADVGRGCAEREAGRRVRGSHGDRATPSPAGSPPLCPRRCRAHRTARCSRLTTCGTPTSPSCPLTPTAPRGCAAWIPVDLPAPGFRAEHRRLPVRHAVHGRHEQAQDRARSSSSTPARATGAGIPFGPDTPIEGGKNARRRPARHHGGRHDLHTVRALAGAVLGARIDGGLGCHVAPELQCAAPGELDVS